VWPGGAGPAVRAPAGRRLGSVHPGKTSGERPRWLEPDEEEAWVSLTGVLLKLPFALDARLRRTSGIGHFEYLVLSVLSETADHTMAMGDLATLANSSPSRTSHAVSRLEAKGWVSRQQDARNGRFMLARLTDEGFAFQRSAAPGHVATVRSLVFDALDADQVKHLDDIAKNILGMLHEQGHWPPRGTRPPAGSSGS
jgi:DNA-binding MarR family transcriptional regulator